jgi:hypothetical protein
MHEDFYSVATTVVLVFLLGGMYAVNSLEAGGLRGWRALLVYGVVALPAASVVFLSLGVLSEANEDTAFVRTLIRWLVGRKLRAALRASWPSPRSTDAKPSEERLT